MERPKFHSSTERRLHIVRNARERFKGIAETNGSGLFKEKLDSARNTDLFADTVISLGEKREKEVERITSTLLPRLELLYQDLVKERLLELKNAGNISEAEYEEALGVKEEKKHVDGDAVSPEEVPPVIESPVEADETSSNGSVPALEVPPKQSSEHGTVSVNHSKYVQGRVNTSFNPIGALNAHEENPDAVRFEEIPRDPNKHYHKWNIGEPNGPTSEGVCGCGAHKQFKNFIPDSDFTTNTEHRLAV